MYSWYHQYSFNLQREVWLIPMCPLGGFAIALSSLGPKKESVNELHVLSDDARWEPISGQTPVTSQHCDWCWIFRYGFINHCIMYTVLANTYVHRSWVQIESSGRQDTEWTRSWYSALLWPFTFQDKQVQDAWKIMKQSIKWYSRPTVCVMTVYQITIEL